MVIRHFFFRDNNDNYAIKPHEMHKTRYNCCESKRGTDVNFFTVKELCWIRAIISDKEDPIPYLPIFTLFTGLPIILFSICMPTKNIKTLFN